MSFKSGKEGQIEEEEEIAHLTKTDALIWMAGGHWMVHTCTIKCQNQLWFSVNSDKISDS